MGARRLTEAATLLVSELVTNSILHARSTLEIAVTRRPRAVRVDVVDASPLVPVVRGASDSEVSGRGLALVDALSTGWGVDRRAAGGKSVQFALAEGQVQREFGGDPGNAAI